MKTTIVKDKHKVRLEYSHGATDWEEVTMTYDIQADPMKQYGSFEMYSDDGEYYAEGGLWFEKGELVDYDGIFELPSVIKKQLIKWGFEVDGEKKEDMFKERDKAMERFTNKLNNKLKKLK